MKLNKNQYKDNLSGKALVLTASFRLFWIGVLIFVLAPFSGVSQVSSSIDTLQMRIGEELQFRIEVEADSTDLVVFPEGTFAPMEVIESYEIDTTYSQAKYRLIKKYGLTQFDSGAYTIPTQKVYINEKQFITDAIEIYVIDVVVDTIQQRMFDIKPVIEIERPPFDFLNLLYWLIPILILVAAYIFFRRKKKKDSEEQQLPPFEEAMVALKELDNSSLLQENKSKE